ncbi:fumarylacetoacetate hydrolase family protein [Actinobacteria bacterium YIM 96077]|uniref:Fumarylacetoacetate hydrolase n=1 Tax=Phytoactinopolyspora halophila TaxID=1981511 RepID=A0A329QAJ6_9ACTN|nr:fumarylacetoacetate hydrolase family protein [Phytoactinopolyspora halophila]AYY13712.1 fumarylacetoacetate hydrolase family protein [Actinobacteria bacterium YIM 96077]RAW09356.1 fumarylacetoacetate hydrolase [Phytoactinopolyspora halophila]
MRYVTYESRGRQRVGYLDSDTGDRDGGDGGDGGDVVIDAGFDGDMVAFIEAGAPLGQTRPVSDAVLRAPLRPRTLRDFMAFEGHLKNAFAGLGKQIPDEWYAVPAYYKGLPETVIGPDEEIPWPSYTEKLDHELELAAVIGRAGKDIPRARAMDHVFGYTIWNDMSARDVQTRELPVGMGPCKAKDWDGSNVLGPCIATPDEFGAAGIVLRVRVNGEVWGEDTSTNMHHTFADMIAYASRDLTVRAGEVLGSGTIAGGSGLELGRWLQPGDLVEMEADGIGVLRNRVGPGP